MRRIFSTPRRGRFGERPSYLFGQRRGSSLGRSVPQRLDDSRPFAAVGNEALGWPPMATCRQEALRFSIAASKRKA
jgi:hypothetical protein